MWFRDCRDMCKQFKCDTSKRFVSFLTRTHKTKASVTRFLTRRRQAGKILEKLESHRGTEINSAMVTPGLRVTFSKREGEGKTNSAKIQLPDRLDHPIRGRNRKGGSVKCKNQRVVKQKGDLGNARISVGFFQSGILETKAHGRMAAHPRRVRSQHKLESSNIQDGYQSSDTRSDTGGYVGYERRLLGRLPPHTHQKSTQTVPVFPSGTNTVLVHSTPIWVVSSPESVHDSLESGQGMGASPTHDHFSVSRRLVELEQPKTAGRTTNVNVRGQMCVTRVAGEPQEIRTHTDTSNSVFGSNIQFCDRKGVPDTRAATSNSTQSGEIADKSQTTTGSGRKSVGQVDSHRKNSTNGSLEPKGVPKMRKTSCTQGTRPRPTGTDDNRGMARPAVVAGTKQCQSGANVPQPATNLGGADRRIQSGLGSVPRGPIVSRQVDTKSESASYQCIRDEGGVASAECVRTQVARHRRPVFDRQHNSRFTYHKTGRYTLGTSDASNARGVRDGTEAQCTDSGTSYSGFAKCISRSSIAATTSHQHRMAAQRRSFSVDRKSISVGKAQDRSFRQQNKPSAVAVCFTVPGRGRDSHRRTGVPLAKNSALCFSSSSDHASVSEQDGTRERTESVTSSTMDTECNLVPASSGLGRASTSTITNPSGDAQSTALELLAPGPGTHGITSVVSENTLLKQRGFSAKVLRQMQKARATSTSAVYDSKWKLFQIFCEERTINPFGAGAPTVADFLQWVFDTREASVRTIQGYRSAIAAKLKAASGYDPGQDPQLSILMKSFLRTRPVPDRTIVHWDLNVVLHFFKWGKWKNTDLLLPKEITLKCVFLLALASGKRRSELHALDNVLFTTGADRSRVVLKPRADFLGKTHFSTRGAGTFTEISIPCIASLEGATAADNALCPVRVLRRYKQVSDEYRHGNQKRLIISFVQGRNHDITKQAISNYLKMAVQIAYMESAQREAICDTFSMRPHDLRGIALSLKACTNVSMTDILAAGVWSSVGTFLKHYVKDFTHNELTKLFALGPFVAGESIIQNE